MEGKCCLIIIGREVCTVIRLAHFFQNVGVSLYGKKVLDEVYLLVMIKIPYFYVIKETFGINLF